MKTDPLVLAVDIGTSSVRTLVFNSTGTIVARRQIQYGTIRPQPYFEEQDPEMVRQEVWRAIRELLQSKEVSPSSIEAIAFSSQMYSTFPVDASGRALSNSIIWSDGRAEPQADRIKRDFTPLGLYSETGCPINSIYPIAKIAWFRENKPELFGKAAKFVSIKEYVTHSLIGEWVVDYSMASSTGMFDIRRHVWHTIALAAAGLRPERLSRPVSGLARFTLKDESPLAGLDLRQGLPIFLGGGDGPLANLGSGASGVGGVNIDLGTSGAARVISDTAIDDANEGLWCYCLTEDLWASGGIVSNVGNAYQWLASNVVGVAGLKTDEAYDLMNKLAEEAAPGSKDLLFLPYLRRARSPYWDARLKGTLYGLNADHGVGDIARSLLEAIAYDLRTILGMMNACIATEPFVVFTGGLAKSPILPQLLADVLGREVRTPDDSEGSVAGAAIMGLHGLGILRTLAFEGGPRRFQSFTPQGERTKVYKRAYARYTRLIKTLREIELDPAG